MPQSTGCAVCNQLADQIDCIIAGPRRGPVERIRVLAGKEARVLREVRIADLQYTRIFAWCPAHQDGADRWCRFRAANCSCLRSIAVRLVADHGLAASIRASICGKRVKGMIRAEIAEA